MKRSKWIITAIVAVAILIIGAKPATINRDYVSIQQASENGDIRLKIIANGSGHSGNCIDMEISNLGSDSGYYRVEAGRRFPADDSTAQDILVIKQRNIRLAPGEKKNLSVYGFCCQATHHGPLKNSGYEAGKMASSDLARLAQYLNGHNFAESSMQQAVWVVSNNHPLASIISDNMDSIQELREMVAGIKHMQVPWYGLIYDIDTNQLFSGKYTRINGQIKYNVSNNGIINISVYDSYGMLIKTLSDGPADPNSYIYQLSLDVRGWLPGKYHVCVTLDDVKKSDKVFEL